MKNNVMRKEHLDSKTFRRIVSAFLFLLMAVQLPAQDLSVKGTVTDTAGEPIIGAAVQVEGTSNGTITDLDGNYTLNNVPSGAHLVFSYVGMETQKVAVNGRTTVNATLKEDAIQLEETVVIGYGSIKKSDLTGAVSVVKTEDFKNRNVTSVGDALQGAAPGVTVRSSGGLGDLPSIQIRGTGNLTNNDPLYIIDGVPTDNNIGFNPNDIETIQILKDASAAAIYGSRAANGVIIITTKNGKEGKTKIELSAQLSVQNLNKLDFVDGDEWRSIMTQVYQNGINKGSYSGEIPSFWQNNTDWQDEYMKTGFLQEYNLGVSGGGENSKFRISFGYMDNSGYNIGQNLDRFTANAKSQFTRGIFTFGESIQLGKTNRKYRQDDTCDLDEVVKNIPIIPVHDDVYGKNGWGYGNSQYAYTNAYNVVATADDSNGYRKLQELYMRASAWMDVKLTDWLTYKLNVGANILDTQYSDWGTGYQYAYGFTDTASFANANSARTNTYLIENTLSANKTLGKHNIAAVVGQSYQDENYRFLSAASQDLVTSAGGSYLINVSGGTTVAGATGTTTEHRLLSYFGRLNYDFDGKYLVQATVRRDGTSRFAKDNRWGTFPSVSLGWRISNENFYHIKWMNELKLRASYGVLGSQNVGNYDYQSIINSYTGYAFNGGTSLTSGQAIVELANSNITWEKKETTNIGLDMGFFDNRLQASLEYYISKSKDVLYTQSILKTVGSTSNPVVNSASIDNKGVELSLNWKDKINSDWSYSVGVNLSHNKNTLTGLGYGVDSYDATTTLSKVGESIGLFYLIKTDGLYQTDEEAQADGLISTAKAGDVKYIDYNGDGSITQDDRQLLTDKSPWPKLEASLNLTVNYKNWSAQVFGFGQFFKYVFNGTRLTTDALTGQTQISKEYAKNAWSETNKHNDARYPRESWNSTENDISYSDRWLERGDFFKFSTLSVGYNYRPKGFLGKFIESAKFTVTAQNFLCLTGFSGYDPDFTNSNLFTPGYVTTSNPNPRSFIFGVNVNF